MTIARELGFTLPAWMFDELDFERARPSTAERMDLAIELSRRNVEHGGGPFGAVVFERETGRVVAPGANLVVQQGSSLLHAEITALAFAQASVGTFTLAGNGCELVTSSEPCVQCLGAVYWSGISRLVCGAPVADAEAVGFDEGPRREQWLADLGARGIEVELGVLAPRAREVLVDYVRRGGIVYNAKPSRV
ncbi:MAG TPA: nucleoside deaminase [Polyangiaceae bacterium]|nr:nucleoside deaminase [Polyangiaceae bacterium]